MATECSVSVHYFCLTTQHRLQQFRDVFRLVLKEGMAPVLAGIMIGIAAGVALARTMQSFVFGISSVDPVTFAGVAAGLILVALLACYVPARRATRVDPLVALRYD